jgi:hypothetical protein
MLKFQTFFKINQQESHQIHSLQLRNVRSRPTKLEKIFQHQPITANSTLISSNLLNIRLTVRVKWRNSIFWQSIFEQRVELVERELQAFFKVGFRNSAVGKQVFELIRGGEVRVE